MKTAITISINVKPRFATGRVRPTRRGTSPPDPPADESVRLADSRIGGQRRIGQVTPCAPNHKARKPQEPNPKFQLSSCGCMQPVDHRGILSPLDEDEPASSPAPIPKYTKNVRL